MLPIIVAAAAAVLAFFLWWRFPSSRLDDIPGPKGLPFVGNAFQLPKYTPHLHFEQWAKKHGDIFKIRIFHDEFVIVNGFKCIQKAYSNADLAGRDIAAYRYKVWGELGVAFSDYTAGWKGRRKLFNSHFNLFSHQTGQIEDATESAYERLIDRLSKSDGKPVAAHHEVYSSIIDMVMAMIIGDSIDIETHKKIATTVNVSTDAMGSNISGLFLDVFPFLRHLGNEAYKNLTTGNQMRNSLIKLWEKDNPTTGFIHLIQNLDPAKMVKYEIDDMSARNTVIWEVFVGSVHTSSTSMAILINILSHLPETQKRLQHELIDVVGQSRRPKMSDRDSMPLHQATIMELNRFITVAPLAVTHKALKDTEIDNIVIPGNTKVIINLWSMHHEEEFWHEPYKFDPDRFLDDNGELVGPEHPNRCHLFAFGRGIRTCPGEAFAMTRLFVILARLMQSFTILPETTIDKQPSMDPRHLQMGLVLRPIDYRVRFKPL